MNWRPVVVGVNRWRSGWLAGQFAKNPNGTNMKDANGDFFPQKDPTPLKAAKVIYEYAPSTDSWEPVTYFTE